MQITTAIGNAMLDALDAADGGTLQFHDAAHGVIASLDLSDPAFGAPVNGVVTAEPITDAVTSAGTIAHAHLYDGTTELCTFTVGLTGAEINLSSLVYNSGDGLSVNSLTITIPVG